MSDSPQAPATGTSRVKRGMAEMLKGGVIMDVTTAEQARIAERADRLVAILIATGLSDLLRVLGVDDHVMWLIPVALALLAVASTITVVQRILVVRRQALAMGTPTE